MLQLCCCDCHYLTVLNNNYQVKDKSKKAYSNFMSRIDDLRDSPEKSPGGSPNALRRGRPQTIPVSSLRPQRPPRVGGL